MTEIQASKVEERLQIWIQTWTRTWTCHANHLLLHSQTRSPITAWNRTCKGPCQTSITEISTERSFPHAIIPFVLRIPPCSYQSITLPCPEYSHGSDHLEGEKGCPWCSPNCSRRWSWIWGTAWDVCRQETARWLACLYLYASSNETWRGNTCEFTHSMYT